MSSTSSLAACVSTLQTSLSLLDSSISILDSGVADFPRLAKVLTTTRHFTLIPTSTLNTAQRALHDEIAPEVTRLLSRVETELDRLERREGALRARAELLDGRLGGTTAAGRGERDKRRGSASAGTGTGPKDVKMRMLLGKKERLAYAVERLALQAKQRERQLRMSVAAQ